MAGGIALAVPNKPGKKAAAGSVFKMRDKPPKHWEKWHPEISLSGQQPHSSATAKPHDSPASEELVHHKGKEAGEKKKSKHWYRRLF